MPDDDLVDYEGPLLVAAGTDGNRRFGALLKNLRERSGLSPQELAERAEVHVSFVRGIERGAQAPSVATARPLLGCMKVQDQTQWMDNGPYDLLICDPGTGRNVAFKFKAKVKGQNRRIDDAPIVKALMKVGSAARQASDSIGLPAGEPRADVVGLGDGGQPQWGEPADQAAFGRVVRLLAAVDGQMLARVESLLRDESDRV